MAVTVEDLAKAIGSDVDGKNGDSLTRALSVASALLEDALERAVKPVPEPVLDEMTLDVASAVYRRLKNQPVASGFDNTAPLRAPNDPLQQVRPMLRLYVGTL